MTLSLCEPVAVFSKRQNIKKNLSMNMWTLRENIKISLYADALKARASPKMVYDMSKPLAMTSTSNGIFNPGQLFHFFMTLTKTRNQVTNVPGSFYTPSLFSMTNLMKFIASSRRVAFPDTTQVSEKPSRKRFCEHPYDGARINSGFGNRKHPIKGYTKMHKGVDFGAPKGTPIMAAGDGVVERCNKYGGYGNYICIRHNGSYKDSLCSPQSLCKRGTARVSKVRQGQVIGYVGATGSTTGPHLHFELLHNGKHVNPQKVTQLPKSKLVAKC